MIYTGIYALDNSLGGIPRGSRVIFSLEPEVEGQLFLLNALKSALHLRRNCLVIIPHTTTEIYSAEVSHSQAVNPAEYSDIISFIDSEVVSFQIESGRDTSEDEILTSWRSYLETICSERKIEVVFCYLDHIASEFGFEKALGIFDFGATANGPTVIFEYLNLYGGGHLSELTDSFKFDLAISLRSGYQFIPFFNYFTVEYVSWMQVKRTSIPFITIEGMVVPHIPKIVVTGPPDSGKSTFVRSVSDSGISVDRQGLVGGSTTVALDVGHLECRGFHINIYGTPGQSRFDPILPQLVSRAMGIILVVDVTHPENFPRAIELMEKSRHNLPVPVVIAANKSDLPHEVTEEYIRSSLKLGPDVQIFFISALRKSDAIFVVESLIDSITRFP